MIKNLFLIIISLFISIIFIEFLGNALNLRPKIWSENQNYGWYTWSGSDHISGIHSTQLNTFKTRGRPPLKKNKIIILGDSNIETSRNLEEMPEKFLEEKFNDYSIVSFGSWGWGNDQQLLHLKENISKIKPKIVLLWFSPNDLKDNYEKIGFLGIKPTFRIEKDKLIYPKEKLGDENKKINFYIYRLIDYSINIKNKFLLKKQFKFTNQLTKKCSDTKKYSSYKDLLVNYFDENMYEYTKNHKTKKPMPYNNQTEIFPSKEEWIKNSVESENSIFFKENIDNFFWLRNLSTKNELYQIKLTNLILREIQRVSYDNGAEFVIFFPYYKKFLPFFDNSFTICRNGIELEYANYNAIEKLNKIFEGINYKYFLDLEGNNFYETSNITYDEFDGHLSSKTTNFIMKKISIYLKKNFF